MNAERLLQLYDRVSEAPDAVPRLRRFILDLAMRGKLVQQDPNDEPALKDVFQARMVSNNTPRKKKTKRGEVPTRSSNTPPFLLPKQWAWTKFGRLHDLIRGVTYSKSDVGEGAGKRYIPVLRANNIGVTLNLDNPVYVRRERISEAQLLRRGDFMIALSSGSKNLVGKAAYVPEDLEAAFGGFCGVIRLHDHQLEDFVRIYLKSDLYRKSISEGSRGIGINNLKKDVLASTAFPLPPRAEQNRIVAKVDELMSLCDRLEAEREESETTRDRLATASLSRLTVPGVDEKQFKAHADFAIKVLPELTSRPDQIKVLRQTILDLAVRGKLVEQDPSDEPAADLIVRIIEDRNALIEAGKLKKKAEKKLIGETDPPFRLPCNWAWCRLGSIFYLVTDGAHHTPKYIEHGVPFLSVKDVSSGIIKFDATRFISPEEHLALSKRCHPVRGDILLTKVGTTGIAVPVKTDREFSIFVSLALLKFSQSNLSQGFLCYLLNSPFVRRQSAENTQGIGNKNLVLRLINSFLLPIPPLAEQHRIVARVDELMNVCDHLERGLSCGQYIEKGLLETLLIEALKPATVEAA